eukprot:gene23373-36626_t
MTPVIGESNDATASALEEEEGLRVGVVATPSARDPWRDSGGEPADAGRARISAAWAASSSLASSGTSAGRSSAERTKPRSASVATPAPPSTEAGLASGLRWPLRDPGVWDPDAYRENPLDCGDSPEAGVPHGVRKLLVLVVALSGSKAVKRAAVAITGLGLRSSSLASASTWVTPESAKSPAGETSAVGTTAPDTKRPTAPNSLIFTPTSAVWPTVWAASAASAAACGEAHHSFVPAARPAGDGARGTPWTLGTRLRAPDLLRLRDAGPAPPPPAEAGNADDSPSVLVGVTEDRVALRTESDEGDEPLPALLPDASLRGREVSCCAPGCAAGIHAPIGGGIMNGGAKIGEAQGICHGAGSMGAAPAGAEQSIGADGAADDVTLDEEISELKADIARLEEEPAAAEPSREAESSAAAADVARAAAPAVAAAPSVAAALPHRDVFAHAAGCVVAGHLTATGSLTRCPVCAGPRRPPHDVPLQCDHHARPALPEAHDVPLLRLPVPVQLHV